MPVRKKDDETIKSTPTHSLTHSREVQGGMDSLDGWMAQAGWIMDGDGGTADGMAQVVTGDGTADGMIGGMGRHPYILPA